MGVKGHFEKLARYLVGLNLVGRNLRCRIQKSFKDLGGTLACHLSVPNKGIKDTASTSKVCVCTLPSLRWSRVSLLWEEPKGCSSLSERRPFAVRSPRGYVIQLQSQRVRSAKQQWNLDGESQVHSWRKQKNFQWVHEVTFGFTGHPRKVSEQSGPVGTRLLLRPVLGPQPVVGR